MVHSKCNWITQFQARVRTHEKAPQSSWILAFDHIEIIILIANRSKGKFKKVSFASRRACSLHGYKRRLAPRIPVRKYRTKAQYFLSGFFQACESMHRHHGPTYLFVFIHLKHTVKEITYTFFICTHLYLSHWNKILRNQ